MSYNPDTGFFTPDVDPRKQWTGQMWTAPDGAELYLYTDGSVGPTEDGLVGDPASPVDGSYNPRDYTYRKEMLAAGYGKGDEGFSMPGLTIAAPFLAGSGLLPSFGLGEVFKGAGLPESLSKMLPSNPLSAATALTRVFDGGSNNPSQTRNYTRRDMPRTQINGPADPGQYRLSPFGDNRNTNYDGTNMDDFLFDDAFEWNLSPYLDDFGFGGEYLPNTDYGYGSETPSWGEDSYGFGGEYLPDTDYGYDDGGWWSGIRNAMSQFFRTNPDAQGQSRSLGLNDLLRAGIPAGLGYLGSQRQMEQLRAMSDAQAAREEGRYRDMAGREDRRFETLRGDEQTRYEDVVRREQDRFNTLLGLRNQDRADQLADIEWGRAQGAPYREAAAGFERDPTSYMTSPLVTGAVEQGTGILGRALSAKAGNPALSGGTLQELQNYATTGLFDRFQENQKRLGTLGGLPATGGNTVRGAIPNLSTSINTSIEPRVTSQPNVSTNMGVGTDLLGASTRAGNNRWNALGVGWEELFNPGGRYRSL